MAGANDPVATYARAFFDRDADTLNAHLGPDWRNGGTLPLDFVREHFARSGAEDPVAKALRIDSTVMLVDDPVKRVDNMTMAWGLEARVPFLTMTSPNSPPASRPSSSSRAAARAY
jgi:asparagine synthase (glutamine-hydrolysing)